MLMGMSNILQILNLKLLILNINKIKKYKANKTLSKAIIMKSVMTSLNMKIIEMILLFNNQTKILKYSSMI